MSGDASSACLFSSYPYHYPVVATVFMHMKSEINRAAVDLNQTYTLLGDISPQSTAMPGLQCAHEASEGVEAQQSIASIFSVSGIVAALGYM
ncbi:hypothetical protein D3C74_369020 [compost metagenome]